MESTDQYNYSLFRPRNKHGRKNRNVILTMLLIWAVAVFGFQFLLRIIEKPLPEDSLVNFETLWPQAVNGTISGADMKTLLASLVHVRGKNTVKPAEQRLLTDAISTGFYSLIPDSIRQASISSVTNVKLLKNQLVEAKGEDYLSISNDILKRNKALNAMILPYSGFSEGSLESHLLAESLESEYPASYSDQVFTALPAVMKLYLTHNRSVLTDTKFLGFPFHYFYTAVFLLVLFVGLCITYNILVEWRLKKEGVVE